MDSADSDLTPSTGGIDLPSGGAGEPPAVMRRSARLWGLTLMAGVIAGVVAWLGGEACLDLIKPPLQAVNSRGMTLRLVDRRQQAAADARNAGLAFAILGAALGAGMGATGGIARRSGRAAARAAIIGLVAGSAAGAAMSLALLPPYNVYKSRYPDEASSNLLLPLLLHAGVWSAVGAAGGLAYAVGLGERRLIPKVVLGGLAGAAAGAAVYELIGALAFPAAKTAQFVSATWQTRLLARLAVTVLAAIGAVLGLGKPRERPTSPPP